MDDEVFHTYIYMEYYSSTKSTIMSFIATWIITLSEVSRTEKDKYHMILLISEI